MEKKYVTGTEIKNRIKKYIKNNYKERFIVERNVRNNSLEIETFRIDYTDAFIDTVIQKYQEMIIEALIESGEVQIRGFMTFYTKSCGRNVFRNPKTGEIVKRIPSKKLRIKTGKYIDELLREKN